MKGGARTGKRELLAAQGLKGENTSMERYIVLNQKKKGCFVSLGTSQKLLGRVTGVMSAGGAGGRWQLRSPVGSCGTTLPSSPWMTPGWAAQTMGVIFRTLSVLILNLRGH